jgi:hypothetical protein
MSEFQSGKYLETISGMNRAWAIMNEGYFTGDCRTKYLKMFELALNANIHKHTLWQNPRYAAISRLYPLPRDAEYVSEDKYRLYIWLYTEVMRDEGLLTATKGQVDPDDDGDDMFKM